MILTPRQRQVAELVAQACTDREIAHKLGLTAGTVKSYLRHVRQSCGFPAHGNYRVRLARLIWRDEAIARCDREIAAIEALPMDHPPDSCAALGWLDWHAEKRILEGKE